MQECSKCGEIVGDGLKFCTSCGAQISASNQKNEAVCPKCHVHYPEGAVFCTNCGAKFEALVKNIKNKNSCTKCSAEIPEGVKFCISCGTHLADDRVKQPSTQYSPYIPTGHNVAQNRSALPQGAYTPVPAFQQKPVKKGKKIGIIAAVAAVLVVTVGVYTLLPDLLKGFKTVGGLEKDEVKWEFAGDMDEKLAGKPEKAELSGSRSVNISSKDGFNISVPKNALDKDRKFEIKRLNKEDLKELFFDPVYDELLTVAAYEMHAGLAEGEVFPGDVKLSFDLAQFKIPEAAYEDIRIVRRGEKEGDVEILRGQLTGSTYECYTNKNSIIEVVVITGIGVSLLFGALGYYENDKKFTDAFGRNGKWSRMSYPKDSTYTLYWPSGLGMANPTAVRAALLEEVELYKELGYIDPGYNPQQDIDKAIAGETTFNTAQVIRDHVKRNALSGVRDDEFAEYVLKIVYDHPDYFKLKKKYDQQWRMDNVWPAEVKICIEQLMRADDYLFHHRKIKKPSSVEVFMSDKITEYGFSDNPSTGRPYLTVGLISKKNFQNLGSDNTKKWLDNYLITISHELFHVAQSARYIYTVDWKSNNWFWEATATLLENEAAAYFMSKDDKNGKKIISPSFTVEKHSYYEAYARPPAMTSYWGELKDNDEAKQNQGYMAGYLLMFLRDRYYGQQSGDLSSDSFLINLLNTYKGSIKNPFYTIVAQTSNSEKLIRKDIRQFYESVAADVAGRTDMTRTAKGSLSVFKPWVITEKTTLSQTSPVAKIKPIKNPYSTLIRVLDLKIDKNKYKKDDVKLVLIQGEENMQKPENFMLRVCGDNKKFDFEYLDEPEAQEYKDVAYGDQMYIQEIHLYGDTWFGDFSEDYKAFLMTRPDTPKLEEKSDSKNKDEKTLLITMPKSSPLFTEGLVKKWRITFTDPLGKKATFQTDKDTYEIPITNKDGSIDFNNPQIKKDMEAALKSQMAADLNLKEGVEKGYKGNTSKLIQDVINGIDLNALNQSAQILMSGGIKNKYTVTVCEVTETTKPIFGPESKAAVLESAFSAAGTDLSGTWTGKMAFTNETMTAVISPGSDGHQYIMKLKYYGDAAVYVDDLGDGRLKISAIKGKSGEISIEQAAVGAAFDGATMTLNSKDEIQMLSPPCTLKRKK
ncbi:MAG: zinc ribbon domain-containing protein [Clostridia bacterium]